MLNNLLTATCPAADILLWNLGALTMRRVVLSAFVLGLGAAVSTPALAGESGVSSAAPIMMANRMGSNVTVIRHGNNWGQRIGGRWWAGSRAPGGWVAYRRPFYGFTLPTYWVNPSYYISNYSYYGLPAPAYGYGWSRYYDDAVLTDRWGRVIDYRAGYDWDRYDSYDDDRGDDGYSYDERYDYDRDDRGYYDDDRRAKPRRKGSGDAIGGAVIGGVVGGLAGNAIAGRGNRTAGTILGAGVGAIAGAAIGDATGKDRDDRRYRDGYSYGYRGEGYGSGRPAPAPRALPYRGYADDEVSYDGRWTGTWVGRDGSTYSGTYDGRYEGGAGYATGPALPYQPLPHYGYSVGGNYYEATRTVVDVVPATVETYVTETTTYTTKARKTVARKRPPARVRVKASCSCSCLCK